MATAAQGLLKQLDDQQRQKVSFNYNDPERLNWHFIPRERKGLPLKELEGDLLKSAKRLVASGLSEAGYDQAVKVMSLEEVLFLLEPVKTRPSEILFEHLWKTFDPGDLGLAGGRASFVA